MLESTIGDTEHRISRSGQTKYVRVQSSGFGVEGLGFWVLCLGFGRTMAASVPCPSRSGQTRRKCPRSTWEPPPTCTWEIIQGFEISECPRSE